MKRKQIVSVLFLAAAAMALNGPPSWAQTEGSKEKSGRSERTGSETETPLPKGSPSAGSTDPSKAGKGPGSGSAQSGKDTSVGGSQSERVGSGETPLPKGSPSAGSTEPSKAGKGPASGTAQGSKDTSVGGTRSERSGSDGETPLPKGSRSAGSSDMDKAGEGSRSASQGMGQQDVRQAQEALKNQGHNPGPIDGVMGSQTRQALREFQSKNGLKQTGTLDAETKQKLNIEGSSSGRSSGSATGSGSGSGSMGKGESSGRQKEPSSSPMGK